MTVIGFNPKHNYDVRLVAADGAQLGIYRLQDAVRMASEQGLDIVNMSPQARPPVAKIMDWGKHKYKQKQIEKEAKKKQHVVVLKEIKIGVNIEKHDLDVKRAKIKEFLGDGCKVRISIRFQGRELAHQDLGTELLDQIISDLGDSIVVESAPVFERREIFVIVRPRSDKKA